MIRFTLAAALVSLALAGAACSVPGAAAAKPSPSPDPYKQALAFSQCMRAHGVTDFPDPQQTSGGGTGIQVNGNGTTLDPSSSVFQAAATACKKYSPANGPNGKGPSAKDRQALLAFAACMRTHGVPDFPDPNFSSGGSGFSGASGSGSEPPADMRPDSPQFQTAYQACKSKLPAGGKLSTSGNGK
jgi:hypothetical protein